jgi:hypothetical protein
VFTRRCALDSHVLGAGVPKVQGVGFCPNTDVERAKSFE